MITGNETQRFHNAILSEMMSELRDECRTGGSVNEACIESITETGVYRYVYGIGSLPDLYNRRYDGGGLADKDNLEITTITGATSISIIVEDKTESNGDGVINADPVTYLSDIIESGAHGRRWPDSDWPGARPYMEPSLQDGCNQGGQINSAIEDLFRNMALRA